MLYEVITNDTDLRDSDIYLTRRPSEKLTRSSLSNADLSGADLCNTDLYLAGLNGVKLTNANLRDANLINRITSYNVCYTKLLRVHPGLDIPHQVGVGVGDPVARSVAVPCHDGTFDEGFDVSYNFV